MLLNQSWKRSYTLSQSIKYCMNQNLHISNGNFNFDSWFNAHRSDLLHNFSWTVQVNETFVNSHLKAIPRLRSFTTRGFTSCDGESFGGQTHRTFHHQFLLFSSSYEFSAHLFRLFTLRLVKVMRMWCTVAS